MAAVSKHKQELAVQTTADLIGALAVEVPERLKHGFVDLFKDLQSKHLERLRGLLAGVAPETKLEI